MSNEKNAVLKVNVRPGEFMIDALERTLMEREKALKQPFYSGQNPVPKEFNEIKFINI